MTKSLTIAATTLLAVIILSNYPTVFAYVAGVGAIAVVIVFFGLIIEFVTEGG